MKKADFYPVAEGLERYKQLEQLRLAVIACTDGQNVSTFERGKIWKEYSQTYAEIGRTVLVSMAIHPSRGNLFDAVEATLVAMNTNERGLRSIEYGKTLRPETASLITSHEYNNEAIRTLMSDVSPEIIGEVGQQILFPVALSELRAEYEIIREATASSQETGLAFTY